MSGSRIEHAKSALLAMIDQLPADCSFLICSFGNHFDFWERTFQPYNEVKSLKYLNWILQKLFTKRTTLRDHLKIYSYLIQHRLDSQKELCIRLHISNTNKLFGITYHAFLKFQLSPDEKRKKNLKFQIFLKMR